MTSLNFSVSTGKFNHGWTRSVYLNQISINQRKPLIIQCEFALTRHYFCLLFDAFTDRFADSRHIKAIAPAAVSMAVRLRLHGQHSLFSLPNASAAKKENKQSLKQASPAKASPSMQMLKPAAPRNNYSLNSCQYADKNTGPTSRKKMKMPLTKSKPAIHLFEIALYAIRTEMAK
jgi:hypothetical protein